MTYQESSERELRQKAVDRIKTNEMLAKFRISAAKRQAEFYKVSHGRYPRVTKESVDKEAQRLLSEWKGRQRRALPPANNAQEEVPKMSELSNSKEKGNFECPRCLRRFRDQKKYTSHLSTHYSGGGSSENAARMVQADEGRGVERSSSRPLSEAEKEDLRYFINDTYQ